MKTILYKGKYVWLAAGIFAVMAPLAAPQPKSNYLSPPGYITGVVQGEKGPEAGVWVIAETKEMSTNFIKIVVTDDRGRFLLPEQPVFNYKVWVRGYGWWTHPRWMRSPPQRR